MSIAQLHEGLHLPGTLQTQLHEFRRRVWLVKMIEVGCEATFGILGAFLLLFALDRVCNTPVWGRVALFLVACAAFAWVGSGVHRWIWRNRRLDQLARLLCRKQPQVGDQLLGVIELVTSESEQARSRALCEAAIRQVAEDASRRDLSQAVPNPRHRLWSGIVSVPALLVLVLAILSPAATLNAWARLLAPWSAIPRYTFAAVEPFPERQAVAHGEATTLTARLKENTAWRPATGILQFEHHAAIAAPLTDTGYAFELPPQIHPQQIEVRIGDSRQTVLLEPTRRPELSSLSAEVLLPKYLELPEPRQKDVRGGTISVVRGSSVSLTAIATRDLEQAQVDGQEQPPRGAEIHSSPFQLQDSRQIVFQWRDSLGLEGREPFVLAVNAVDDEAPTLFCEDLPRQKVVLESEQLVFSVKARDDFGIRRVGLQWSLAELPDQPAAPQGEKLLAAGGPDKDLLEVSGTFSAQALGIPPGQVNVHVYTEDYLPGRARVVSPMCSFYVLTAEQHAIWLTQQLSKWHRQALEVRDRELQLHDTNRQLRELSPEELDQADNRQRLEQQAQGERSNGRRLSALSLQGEDLIRQGMRNPEFGVGHLEKWAEMLQILQDISANRMPSVADLLKQAAQAPQMAAAPKPQGKTRMAGQNRDTKSNPSAPGEPPKTPQPPSAVPSIVDRESSQQPPSDKPADPPPPGKPSSPRLTLPVTTIAGQGKSGPPKPPAPANDKVEEAVVAQQDLLAEFDKIVDELNRVLANLEGSTLVKRLKAASRTQYGISGQVIGKLEARFGQGALTADQDVALLVEELGKKETHESQGVSLIMDDMQAYFERRRYVKFKSVLDEMRKVDVIGSLRQLGDDLGRRNEDGLVIAQCEFWSDTLDRWADDLVDPACSGACTGCKSKGSLPPSVVLAVLQILEAEINLREETRVAEQAKAGLAADVYGKQAQTLSKTQTELREKLDEVIRVIREIPEGEADFAKELHLLGLVVGVMDEATGILARPETGSPAIAAETEAIELLLQSKKINPKGGGGGGASPGGGGTGTTQDSALALIGRGANEKEVREDRGVSQSSGDAGSSFPEEFRSGLDEYFNRLERGPRGTAPAGGAR